MGKEVLSYNVSAELIAMNALQWKALKVKHALSACSCGLRDEGANKCDPNQPKCTGVRFREVHSLSSTVAMGGKLGILVVVHQY